MKLSFAFLFAWALLLSACDDDLPTKLPEPVRDSIMSESWKVKYYFSENAHIRARLNVGHVIEKQEGKPETPIYVRHLSEGVRIEFVDDAGQIENLITSERGTYNQQQGIADLKGKVVALNSKGEKLQSEQLFWNEKKDSIYTDQPVSFTMRDRVMQGAGFSSDSRMRRYRLKKAQGTVAVDNVN